MKKLALMSGGGAALAAAALAAFLLTPGPSRSFGEEGTFENDCCGTVVLAHGRLSVNGSQPVRYDVGRDANGPYLRPHTYVGVVEDEGFDIDGSQHAQILRLDRLPHPQSIQLPMGTRRFVFRKKGLPAQQP